MCLLTSLMVPPHLLPLPMPTPPNLHTLTVCICLRCWVNVGVPRQPPRALSTARHPPPSLFIWLGYVVGPSPTCLPLPLLTHDCCAVCWLHAFQAPLHCCALVPFGAVVCCRWWRWRQAHFTPTHASHSTTIPAFYLPIPASASLPPASSPPCLITILTSSSCLPPALPAYTLWVGQAGSCAPCLCHASACPPHYLQHLPSSPGWTLIGWIV